MTENELDNLWDEYSKTDMVQRFGQYVYNKTGLELMSTYNASSEGAYSILMKHVRSKDTIQIKNYADFLIDALQGDLPRSLSEQLVTEEQVKAYVRQSHIYINYKAIEKTEWFLGYISHCFFQHLEGNR